MLFKIAASHLSHISPSNASHPSSSASTRHYMLSGLVFLVVVIVLMSASSTSVPRVASVDELLDAKAALDGLQPTRRCGQPRAGRRWIGTKE